MQRAALFAAVLLALSGCDKKASTTPQEAAASSSAAPASSASAAAKEPAATARAPLSTREGQAMMRAPNEPALYLADDDSSSLRRVALTPELTGAASRR